MRRKGIMATLIVVVIGLAVLFNPTKEDFNKMIHKISIGDETTYKEIKLFGFDKIYESGYERKNFYIFSIYTTNGSTNKLWTKSGYAGKDITYLGIFITFIKLN